MFQFQNRIHLINLLNCISTIDTVSAGHIFLEGTDITEIKPKSLARFRRENLGFLFQDFNLLDTLTISENIALALAINKVPAGSVESCILNITEKLNISDILNKYPYQVSGGQKQRCACARAIINNPKLLLADEPTGALDSHSSQMLLSTIQSINEQLGATILMVTHDAFTASYASRILFLKDGEIFMELRKGDDSRSDFFDKILKTSLAYMALSPSDHGKDIQNFIKKSSSAVVALAQFHKDFSVFQKKNTAGIAGGKSVMGYHKNCRPKLFIDTLNGRQQHL